MSAFYASAINTGLSGHDDIADICRFVQKSRMKAFYLSAVRFFGAVASIPFIVGIIGAFFEGAGFLSFLVAIPVAGIILVIGAVALLIRGVRAAQEADSTNTRVGMVLASPILLVITLSLSWPLLISGAHLGNLTRLGTNYGHYETIIERVRRDGKDVSFQEDGGVTYSVDLGPPVRVAFNPAGMLDNWSAIVFDPTGEMMQADGFDPVTGKFAAPDRITKLFGGDLVKCRHLWGDYYSCSFT